jgi:hypothetical protein
VSPNRNKPTMARRCSIGSTLATGRRPIGPLRDDGPRRVKWPRPGRGRGLSRWVSAWSHPGRGNRHLGGSWARCAVDFWRIEDLGGRKGGEGGVFSSFFLSFSFVLAFLGSGSSNVFDGQCS